MLSIFKSVSKVDYFIWILIYVTLVELTNRYLNIYLSACISQVCLKYFIFYFEHPMLILNLIRLALLSKFKYRILSKMKIYVLAVYIIVNRKIMTQSIDLLRNEVDSYILSCKTFVGHHKLCYILLYEIMHDIIVSIHNDPQRRL